MFFQFQQSAQILLLDLCKVDNGIVIPLVFGHKKARLPFGQTGIPPYNTIITFQKSVVSM
jgi:hypothetical protein